MQWAFLVSCRLHHLISKDLSDAEEEAQAHAMLNVFAWKKSRKSG